MLGLIKRFRGWGSGLIKGSVRWRIWSSLPSASTFPPPFQRESISIVASADDYVANTPETFARNPECQIYEPLPPEPKLFKMLKLKGWRGYSQGFRPSRKTKRNTTPKQTALILYRRPYHSKSLQEDMGIVGSPYKDDEECYVDYCKAPTPKPCTYNESKDSKIP